MNTEMGDPDVCIWSPPLVGRAGGVGTPDYCNTLQELKRLNVELQPELRRYRGFNEHIIDVRGDGSDLGIPSTPCTKRSLLDVFALFDGLSSFTAKSQLPVAVDLNGDLDFLLMWEASFGTAEALQKRLTQLIRRAYINRKRIFGTDGQGRNVAHMAAQSGKVAALKVLVQTLGADNFLNLLTAEDKGGMTPLNWIDRNRIHADVVQLLCTYPLLAYEIKAESIEYDMGKMAVQYMAKEHPWFPKEITADIEDNIGKAVLDYAKKRNKAMAVMQRPDVQHNEDECYKEMELGAKRLDYIGKASAGLVSVMFADSIYAAPSNANVPVWSLVCFAFALAAFVASLMVVVAPHHKHAGGMKATTIYQCHLFFLSLAMFLVAVFCFLFGPLMAPNLSFRKTPALQSLLIGPIVLTLIVCVASRIYTTRKLRKQFLVS